MTRGQVGAEGLQRLGQVAVEHLAGRLTVTHLLLLTVLLGMLMLRFHIRHVYVVDHVLVVVVVHLPHGDVGGTLWVTAVPGG